MPSHAFLRTGGRPPGSARCNSSTRCAGGHDGITAARRGARHARGAADAQQASALELGRRARSPSCALATAARTALDAHARVRRPARDRARSALAPRRPRGGRRSGRHRSRPQRAAGRLLAGARPPSALRLRDADRRPGSCVARAAARRPRRAPPCGVDPVRRRERRNARAGRRRHRLGQDGHADLDRRARDRARAWARSSSTRRATAACARSCAAQRAGRGTRRSCEWTPDGRARVQPVRPGRRRARSPTRPWPASASPSRTTCARRSAISATSCARCARPDRRSACSAIVEHLDPARLELLARELPEAEAARDVRLPGLALGPPAERSGGRARPPGDPRRVRRRAVARSADRATPTASICSTAVADAGGRVLQPRIRRRPLLTQMLGAAIVQDLQTTRGGAAGQPGADAGRDRRVLRDRRRAGGAGCSAAPALPGSACCWARRSSPICRPPGRERLLEQVLGNLSVLIAHRQVVPGSAELIASVAGTTGRVEGLAPQRRQDHALEDPRAECSIPTG